MDSPASTHPLAYAALGAAATALAAILLVVKLGSGGVGTLLLTLAAVGLGAGLLIGWSSARTSRPGFQFLREDFLEFCGFVGVLGAFPAVLRFGVRGAADWAGRVGFELAFLGAWVLVTMVATAHGVGALRLRTREGIGP